MDSSLNLPEADLPERTDLSEVDEAVEVDGDVVKVEVELEDEVPLEVDSPAETTTPEPTLMLPTKRPSPPSALKSDPSLARQNHGLKE